MLFCSPRGGSSLVAGIFVRHGFWVGQTFGGPDGRGSGGYVNHENALLKGYMKDHYPLKAGCHKVTPQQLQDGDVSKFCEKIVPQDTPWMFKSPSEYYAPMIWHFPLMTPVFVFRDAQQAVEAHVRRRGEKVRQIATDVVTARYKFMNGVLMNNRTACRVDADRVVQGDLSQIEPILAQYDIDLDHREAMKGIHPSLFTQV